MNTQAVLEYGHQTVLKTVDGLPNEAWVLPNVCGVWSTRDIIAHLASFEQVLVDVVGALLSGSRPTPILNQFRNPHGNFNDEQVTARNGHTPAQVLTEYSKAHDDAMELVQQLPEETCRRPGLLPWYGPEYSLDDFIVYTFYGHKREHCAQIKLFRKRQRV